MAAITANQRSGLRELFRFPHPVNEYAARSVAAMVFALALVIIVADLRWLLFVVAYGFLARVLTGPKLNCDPVLRCQIAKGREGGDVVSAWVKPDRWKTSFH